MFFSGVHTSNGLLCLTVYHLAKNQEVQKKLQEVLDQHITGNMIQDISELRGIKYLRACINETSRITPLVNIATRIDREKDIKYDDGFVIPKGTPVILPLAQVLKDNELWEDSDTFNPDRFRQNGIQYPYQFSPFGFAGGRVCPGKYFAQIEVQYAVATIFKNFNVTVDKNQGPLKFRYLTANSLKEEVYVNFSPRH